MSDYTFLKNNALSFLKNAKHLYKQGEYNLAAFNIEQAMQLMLKYLLAVKVGDFPRTHSLRRLFRETRDICPELWEFYLKHANTIGNIEGAYIASRYYPIYYEEVEVRHMLEICGEFIEIVEKCVS